MGLLVSPSLLSANFLRLENDIQMINSSEADWFHIDIMDGQFVPNISFGSGIVKQIKSLAQKPLDVHLMITEPDRYLETFKDAGADILTVHYEACNHLHRTIQKIKSLGMKAGVSVNPHTDVSLLENIVPDADLFLIMSVNPGFGGQSFIENTYKKIDQLKHIIQKLQSNAMIEVDGGVDTKNAGKLASFGCDVLVAGNAIFASADPKETIRLLKHAK